MKRPKTNIRGEMMCWVCVSSPVDFLSKDNTPPGSKYTEHEKKQFEAALVKKVIQILEEETKGQYCPLGQEQLDKIKELQYSLSREL